MCNECFNSTIDSFPTYTGFEAFQSQFFKKVFEGKLVALPAEVTNEESHSYNSSVYKCSKCSEKWHLSEPDNAWRGYCLTESSYISLSKQQLRSDKLWNRNYFIVIILAIAAILLWILDNN